MTNFNHVKDKRFREILENVYIIVCNTNSWDFLKGCDETRITECYGGNFLNITWELDKNDIDCSMDEFHDAMYHMVLIAKSGWDNYLSNR